MYLKTKELKNFLSLAAPIKSNSIIPIYGYIRLDIDGTLTKTNGSTYIVHKSNLSVDDTILFDEKVLSEFLKECKKEDIEIKKEGNAIWLIDGKRKSKFQTAKQKDFPKLPDTEKEDYFELDSDTLIALGIAAKNTLTSGISHPLEYVHITKGYVVASNTAVFYSRKVEGAKDLVLHVECCNILSQFSNAVYYPRGRYDFFEIGNTLYGFIKPEAKTPDLVSYFIDKQAEGEFIEVNTSEFISFCNTVSSVGAKDIDASFNGNVLHFNYSEIDYEHTVELETTGNLSPSVTFLPHIFGNFMRSLGASKIRFYDAGIGKPAFLVSDVDDPKMKGFAIGTMPAN